MVSYIQWYHEMGNGTMRLLRVSNLLVGTYYLLWTIFMKWAIAHAITVKFKVSVTNVCVASSMKYTMVAWLSQ